MKGIRLLAISSIVLVGIYYVFREIVTRCVGAACDVYIPLSLLLPLLIFATAVAAAGLATVRAAQNTAWFAALLALTVLGIVGPIVGLMILRDNPDTYVVVATFLELLVAITVVGYSFLGGRGVASEKSST